MQEINPANFKISCSAIHKIMTEPKTKSTAEKITECEGKINETSEKLLTAKPGLKTTDALEKKKVLLIEELKYLESLPKVPHLSETTKGYCEEWLKIAIYERRPEFTSKYTDKGNRTEQDAITLLSEYYGWDNAEKNTERKYSAFMHGECDLNLTDKIVDIKSSFSCWTFPLFDGEIPDKEYIWQIQGYMHLWGKKSGSIIYTLMDMPDDMIANELRWKFKTQPTDEEYRAAAAQYIYSDMSDVLRIKSFDFEYDPEMIAAVEKRVVECREYISSLLEKM